MPWARGSKKSLNANLYRLGSDAMAGEVVRSRRRCEPTRVRPRDTPRRAYPSRSDPRRARPPALGRSQRRPPPACPSHHTPRNARAPADGRARRAPASATRPPLVWHGTDEAVGACRSRRGREAGPRNARSYAGELRSPVPPRTDSELGPGEEPADPNRNSDSPPGPSPQSCPARTKHRKHTTKKVLRPSRPANSVWYAHKHAYAGAH